jgi:hypothetical protein
MAANESVLDTSFPNCILASFSYQRFLLLNRLFHLIGGLATRWFVVGNFAMFWYTVELV